jgi:hypothetical protein
MAQSKPALAPLMSRSSADLPAFRVVLTQDKRFDVYDTREFDLALDATFPIGRSSSNAAKPHLMPAKHNAYIESPVVSRSHAILTADARSGVPQVYLTDTGSMHGTFVNGNQLAQNVPKLLLSGDKVQLGADVNRNDSPSFLPLCLVTSTLT